MMKIYTRKNQEILVDGEDYDYLNKFRWSVTNNFGVLYAVRTVDNHKVYMHREIMNTPKNMITDHINGNGLDNRKSNLRLCTRAENSRNRKIMSTNKSGYKGVSWSNRARKWLSVIGTGGKMLFLGYFDLPEDAARVYDKEAKNRFGKFAKTNF